ncbi:DUF3889 domain-containing protein [Paenibacillus paeoniae]|uniref:DUF3889 domain-containing protein n=1 Tax=Paenibacillus paeoniae TaxID=2292705 RepID=A0A371PK67_9BACL|nr:DUF3889 domain-containing protein [Paenibacillus paeoniae]REK76601.1 DUF3889 domain-containing protein [Paenibacillus paeoniae]
MTGYTIGISAILSNNGRWYTILGQVVVKAIFLLLSIASPDTQAAVEPIAVQAAAPAYAKWGKLAMEETAKVYRDASIVDYKYEGRFGSTEGVAEERFLLWLRQGDRQFGVRVSLKIQLETENVLTVKLTETN